uniref:Reverse transcriptase domain-containing protein n=1 Tax=Macrostomum lignano TaxID=282301 RepID=A0A1I8GH56_9PLAT
KFQEDMSTKVNDFLAEAHIMKHLRHPNLLQILEPDDSAVRQQQYQQQSQVQVVHANGGGVLGAASSVDCEFFPPVQQPQQQLQLRHPSGILATPPPASSPLPPPSGRSKPRLGTASSSSSSSAPQPPRRAPIGPSGSRGGAASPEGSSESNTSSRESLCGHRPAGSAPNATHSSNGGSNCANRPVGGSNGRGRALAASVGTPTAAAAVSTAASVDPNLLVLPTPYTVQSVQFDSPWYPKCFLVRALQQAGHFNLYSHDSAAYCSTSPVHLNRPQPPINWPGGKVGSCGSVETAPDDSGGCCCGCNGDLTVVADCCCPASSARKRGGARGRRRGEKNGTASGLSTVESEMEQHNESIANDSLLLLLLASEPCSGSSSKQNSCSCTEQRVSLALAELSSPLQAGCRTEAKSARTPARAPAARETLWRMLSLDFVNGTAQRETRPLKPAHFLLLLIILTLIVLLLIILTLIVLLLIILTLIVLLLIILTLIILPLIILPLLIISFLPIISLRLIISLTLIVLLLIILTLIVLLLIILTLIVLLLIILTLIVLLLIILTLIVLLLIILVMIIFLQVLVEAIASFAAGRHGAAAARFRIGADLFDVGVAAEPVHLAQRCESLLLEVNLKFQHEAIKYDNKGTNLISWGLKIHSQLEQHVLSDSVELFHGGLIKLGGSAIRNQKGQSAQNCVGGDSLREPPVHAAQVGHANSQQLSVVDILHQPSVSGAVGSMTDDSHPPTALLGDGHAQLIRPGVHLRHWRVLSRVQLLHQLVQAVRHLAVWNHEEAARARRHQHVVLLLQQVVRAHFGANSGLPRPPHALDGQPVAGRHAVLGKRRRLRQVGQPRAVHGDAEIRVNGIFHQHYARDLAQQIQQIVAAHAREAGQVALKSVGMSVLKTRSCALLRQLRTTPVEALHLEAGICTADTMRKQLSHRVREGALLACRAPLPLYRGGSSWRHRAELLLTNMPGDFFPASRCRPFHRARGGAPPLLSARLQPSTRFTLPLPTRILRLTPRCEPGGTRRIPLDKRRLTWSCPERSGHSMDLVEYRKRMGRQEEGWCTRCGLEAETLEHVMDVLAPLLWLVYINALPDTIHAASPDTSVSLYADDSAILATKKSLHECKNSLQPALDVIVGWCKRWKVVLSPEKCSYSTFTLTPAENRGKTRLDLNIDGAPLRFEATPTFLGVKFDYHLGFGEHAKDIRRRMVARRRPIQMLADRQTGADQRTLCAAYIATCRSIADYGSAIWLTSAAPSNRALVERQQNACARLITGCVMPSRTDKLLAVANLPLLHHVAAERAVNLRERMARLPADIPVHQSATATQRPRLKNRTYETARNTPTDGGRRQERIPDALSDANHPFHACWRRIAQELDCNATLKAHPRAPAATGPASWTIDNSLEVRFDTSATKETSRQMSAELRAAYAEPTVSRLTDHVIWTDGSEDYNIQRAPIAAKRLLRGYLLSETPNEENSLLLCSSLRSRPTRELYFSRNRCFFWRAVQILKKPAAPYVTFGGSPAVCLTFFLSMWMLFPMRPKSKVHVLRWFNLKKQVFVSVANGPTAQQDSSALVCQHRQGLISDLCSGLLRAVFTEDDLLTKSLTGLRVREVAGRGTILFNTDCKGKCTPFPGADYPFPGTAFEDISRRQVFYQMQQENWQAGINVGDAQQPLFHLSRQTQLPLWRRCAALCRLDHGVAGDPQAPLRVQDEPTGQRQVDGHLLGRAAVEQVQRKRLLVEDLEGLGQVGWTQRHRQALGGHAHQLDNRLDGLRLLRRAFGIALPLQLQLALTLALLLSLALALLVALALALQLTLKLLFELLALYLAFLLAYDYFFCCMGQKIHYWTQILNQKAHQPCQLGQPLRRSLRQQAGANVAHVALGAESAQHPSDVIAQHLAGRIGQQGRVEVALDGNPCRGGHPTAVLRPHRVVNAQHVEAATRELLQNAVAGGSKQNQRHAWSNPGANLRRQPAQSGQRELAEQSHPTASPGSPAMRASSVHGAPARPSRTARPINLRLARLSASSTQCSRPRAAPNSSANAALSAGPNSQLAGQLRISAQLGVTVVRQQLPVFGQVRPGLAQQPQGDAQASCGFAENGAQQDVVKQRRQIPDIGDKVGRDGLDAIEAGQTLLLLFLVPLLLRQWLSPPQLRSSRLARAGAGIRQGQLEGSRSLNQFLL